MSSSDVSPAPRVAKAEVAAFTDSELLDRRFQRVLVIGKILRDFQRSGGGGQDAYQIGGLQLTVDEVNRRLLHTNLIRDRHGAHIEQHGNEGA